MEYILFQFHISNIPTKNGYTIIEPISRDYFCVILPRQICLIQKIELLSRNW